jgi:hypothetical protein
MFFSISAFANVTNLINNLEGYLPKGKGQILMIDNDIVLVDLGTEKNIFPGVILDVKKPGKKILHPITGEVLGVTTKRIGSIQIMNVYSNYSEARILDKVADFNIGDYVVIQPTLPVNIEYYNIDSKSTQRIEQAINNRKRFKIDNTSPFSLKFFEDANSNISLSFYYYDKLLTSFYSTNLIIDVKGNSFNKKIIDFDKGYEFITVCKLDGLNNYLLLADRFSVDIFNLDGKPYDKFKSIDRKFKEIISLDCDDVNGNGKEEIFISVSNNGNGAKSFIYEKGDTNFKLLKENFPFVIRTLVSNDNKITIVQRLTRDGKFIGNINYLAFTGDYIRGNDIENTKNYSIYGIGFGDVNNDKSLDIIRVNNNLALEIYSNKEKIYSSFEKFGDSSFYFTMKDAVKAEKTSDSERDDLPDADIIKSRIYKKDRIFILKNGNIFASKISNSSIIQSFEKSFSKILTLSSFNGSTLNNKWSSEDFGKDLSDYYIIKNGDKYSVFVITTKDGFGFFTKSTSKLVILNDVF